MTSPSTKSSTSTIAPGSGQTSNRPRLGQISFINVLPVVLPYDKEQGSVQADVIYDSPARLNAMFADGALDIGAMSSFFYLESSNLRLIPGISISCKGPVGSVLFFSKQDPKRLQQTKKRIVVSALSATSVNLLRILLSVHYGFNPNLTTCASPDLDQDDVDAVLVIGDRALAVDADWSKKYHRIDLGALWFDTYRVPMTFGVWAAHRAWAEKHPDEFAQIAKSLNFAKAAGLTDLLPTVINEAQRRTGLSTERLHRYFTQELNFDLNAEHLDGMALYQRLCIEHKLLD